MPTFAVKAVNCSVGFTISVSVGGTDVRDTTEGMGGRVLVAIGLGTGVAVWYDVGKVGVTGEGRGVSVAVALGVVVTA